MTERRVIGGSFGGTRKLLCLAAVVGAVWSYPPAAPQPLIRPEAAESLIDSKVQIDHVPIAVKDLDATAKVFAALGFVLKPGRTHRDGIRNQHVKFPDGTSIELITAPANPQSGTASAYRRFLANGDGPAFLALNVAGIDRAATWLDRAGFRYSKTRNFLFVADGEPLSYLFFTAADAEGRRKRSGTDQPMHFAHANGALSLVSVWIAAPDPHAEQALVRSLGAGTDRATVVAPDVLSAETLELGNGRLVLLPHYYQTFPDRALVGLTVAVKSLERTREVLSQNGIRFIDRRSGPVISLIIEPRDAAGSWLEFQEDRIGP